MAPNEWLPFNSSPVVFASQRLGGCRSGVRFPFYLHGGAALNDILDPTQEYFKNQPQQINGSTVSSVQHLTSVDERSHVKFLGFIHIICGFSLNVRFVPHRSLSTFSSVTYYFSSRSTYVSVQDLSKLTMLKRDVDFRRIISSQILDEAHHPSHYRPSKLQLGARLVVVEWACR